MHTASLCLKAVNQAGLCNSHFAQCLTSILQCQQVTQGLQQLPELLMAPDSHTSDPRQQHVADTSSQLIARYMCVHGMQVRGCVSCRGDSPAS